MTVEACEHAVYTCCQINASTLIESYNIVLLGAVEQMDMAMTALKKCTEQQSIVFCCDASSDQGELQIIFFISILISLVLLVAKGFTSNVTCAIIGHWDSL